MPASAKPSGSIIAAAVVEIICSLIAVAGAALPFLVFRFMPMPASTPQLPPAAKTIMEGMMLFFLALGIFGIFTGAGLLRLKNWARITTLIWAGIMVACVSLTLVATLLMPSSGIPNQPPEMDNFAQIFMVCIDVIPVAIGIWWLILFNRKAIVAQFSSGASVVALAATTMPGESFPLQAQATTVKPSCPLPVAVVAGFSILGSLSLVFVFFTRMPALIFGHAVHGPAGTGILVFTCLLNLTAGIGLLLLKRWSHTLSLALQFFGLCSGTVTMLSSNYDALMREALASSLIWTNQAYTDEYFHRLRSFSLIGLLGPVVILVVLLYYRARFLQAASGASASS